mgnify:CR=1 FL=1
MRLILASTSPRRKDLLRSAGVNFTVIPPIGVDERPQRGESPRQIVFRLSLQKAQSVFEGLGWRKKNSVVLGVDTLVSLEGGKRILGKPKDEADALRMLRWISGCEHTVHTGYCLVTLHQRPHCRAFRTKVRMRKVSVDHLRAYVRTGEPMGKAGAYAAQGRGMGLIESIQGSYTNIVGLPLAQVLSDLETRFSDVLAL